MDSEKITKNDIFNVFGLNSAILRLDISSGALWYAYIDSYKTAGDCMVDMKIPDVNIYATIFCYRQYLELLLKNIFRGNNISDDFKQWLSVVNHDLDKIWKGTGQFKGVRTILEQNTEKYEIEYIESVINDFQVLDKSSFEFRYPIEKNLKHTTEYLIKNNQLDDNTMRVNLDLLKLNIDKLDDILYKTYSGD